MPMLVGLAAWLFGMVATAAAQPDGRVGLFVVATTPTHAQEAAPFVEFVDQALKQHGQASVSLSVAPPSTKPPTPVLSEARAVGEAALTELAGERPAADVLTRHGQAIATALELVSAVHDDDGRALLWNLCVLRVQLLLESGAQQSLVGETVGDCRQRFPDQREFSTVWPPEVVHAFRSLSSRVVFLGVQSAPAGCDVLVYGARMGTTPLRLSVHPGTQELQLLCGDGRRSSLHRVVAQASKDVVIRLDGDEALHMQADGRATLLYPTPSGSTHAAEHAFALAQEAGAASVIVVFANAGTTRIEWFDDAGVSIGTVRVPAHPSADAQADAVHELFRLASGGTSPLQASAQPEESTRVRTWKDWALGGALVVGGIGAAVVPFAQLGSECKKGLCELSGTSWALVGTASALVGAGLSVISIAPFGRRRGSVQMGLGYLQVKGAF